MIFYKMHGLGNDYVYLDCINNKEPAEPSKLAVTLSNRNFGVGSDGLILICKSQVADFKMRMFNSDGSEAQMCGNGIRCVAKLVDEWGLVKNDAINIETLAGIKKLKLNKVDKKVKSVTVDMGEPCFEPDKIPVKLTPQARREGRKIEIPIITKSDIFPFICVSMGNPHAVTFVENIEKFPVEKYGKELEKNEAFPQRTNIEFVEVVDRKNIKMRVWERGAGETLACGTGASASVVATVLKEKTDRNVTVELLGGKLEIEWKGNNHIFMTGPAVTVFKGEWINN